MGTPSSYRDAPWGRRHPIKDTIYDANGRMICTLSRQRSRTERELLARAISQVPYLIQALEELVAEYDGEDHSGDTGGIMMARHALDLAKNGGAS